MVFNSVYYHGLLSHPSNGVWSVPCRHLCLHCIAVPIALLIIFIIVVNILQSKRPGVLPHKLQSWEWIPIWLRSLEPYDKIIGKAYGAISCGKGEKPSYPMNSTAKGGIQNSGYQGNGPHSHELQEKDVERGSGKYNRGFADTEVTGRY